MEHEYIWEEELNKKGMKIKVTKPNGNKQKQTIQLTSRYQRIILQLFQKAKPFKYLGSTIYENRKI